MKRLLLLPLLVLGANAAPVAIFDGKTLDGWEGDAKLWRVEDGMITGGSLSEKVAHNDFLATRKSYSNFDLRLKIRLSGTEGFINSGIQMRSLRVPGSPEMSGYQVDYGKGWYGKLYDESRRNRVVGESKDMAAATAAVKEGDWNEYRIRAEGRRIQSWINGVPALDYTESDQDIAQDGHIGIQVHGGGKALVQVKDVTIEELPSTPDAPTWEKLGGVEAARKLVAPKPKPKPANAKPKKDGARLQNVPPGQRRDISYNAIQGTPRTAAEEQRLFHLPEGFEIELVAQESEGIGKFVSVYFDQRGRMWTQTALEYPVDGNENPAAAEALYQSGGRDKVLVYPRESLNAAIPAGGLTNPTVFADGLAIPLGILPWGNGDTCYIQHGHDLKLFKDTNGDGRADTSEVVLTGFGVQDSHLFPHQFTRAPGGWIWMAQGLFNNSKVHKPGSDKVVEWPKCSMARMRPDGSAFEVTSVGPNNIWGLVITGDGEAFIQEANDYGYPVMPFHEYAYYPGGMEALKRSYQPDFPPQAEFRMGGTGLSGLALGEGAFRKLTPTAKSDSLCMFVANPIISKVQTIAMHRDGPYWKLEQATDLITCDDPFFRPVGMTNGPDGCIYIVDWYNKIISHNEVPRSHPDRDKTRGRIWRVKPREGEGPAPALKDGAGTPRLLVQIPDFTTLSDDRLVAALTDGPLGKTHLAWQTLADRRQLPANHWAASEYAYPRESVRIREIGRKLNDENIGELLGFAKPGMRSGSTVQSSRGPRQIPAREAYDREFERFLVRMFLERHPDTVAKFLDSDAAQKLPVEARLLASLALEPKASASRVAKLLPQLQRAPGQEEILRLVQFLDEPGVGDAVSAALANPATGPAVLNALTELRAKLDPGKVAPLVTDAARQLLATKEPARRELGLRLTSAFQITALEPSLVEMLTAGWVGYPRLGETKTFVLQPEALAALRALGELRSDRVELFVKLAQKGEPEVRLAALNALTVSRSAEAPALTLSLIAALAPAERRAALDRLSATKPGARAIVGAVAAGTLPKTDVDAAMLDRMLAVLGDKDAALNALVEKLGTLFRPVLVLDGTEKAYVDTGLTLEGALTVETWVKLEPGIGNADGILCAPGQLDINFFAGQFRVWAGAALHDVVVAKKTIVPEMWTHVAATRSAAGIWRLYIDGELNATGTKAAGHKIENPRIAATGVRGGTKGQLAEFRIWGRERTADEIRANFDRSLAAAVSRRASLGEAVRPHDPDGSVGLVFNSAAGWGRLGGGARVVNTSDLPPVLSAEAASALDAKFSKYRALAGMPGDVARGRGNAMVCQACHLFGSAGGNIGPNLSGVGAMGTEAILRNILTPNAAMEAGYRIYRVEQRDGSVLDAFFVSEDRDAVIIRLPGADDRRVAKKDIVRKQFLRRSLMPEGLLDAMTDQQVRDLFAYLLSLK